jgi:hypothetical protein
MGKEWAEDAEGVSLMEGNALGCRERKVDVVYKLRAGLKKPGDALPVEAQALFGSQVGPGTIAFAALQGVQAAKAHSLRVRAWESGARSAVHGSERQGVC